MANAEEIAREQAYFDAAWEARERKRSALSDAGRAAGGPTKTIAAVRRAGEAAAASLGGPDDPVAFGRFDRDGEVLYIGHHLISSDDQEPLVINWKTRAAEPFYKATVQNPLGLSRKRAYETDRNTIRDFSDTIFAQLAEAVEELTGAEQWGIDDALLRDLDASRTGEMKDIVQTIHASQYDLIQSPLGQLLIIQGGPGTGKTAIALHRISWLLFNHRDELTPEECLVVGPNPTFTRYINAVLPGLGDRDVAYRDLRNLGPVKSHGREEPEATARLKGEARMADLLRIGLRQRVGFPDRADRLVLGVDSLGPSFSREEIEAEIDRLSDRTYNAGRIAFRQFLQAEGQKRTRPGTSLSATAIENGLERVWPQLTPASFLRDLLASRDRLMAAAELITPELTVSDVRGLIRAPADKLSSERWSDADIALLDELDYLINGRQTTYAHIVVDEAQDLSPMQLRSVRRRSRTGSMTIVGDIAQSTGLWARDSWAGVEEALTLEAPCITHELSLGYRVPRQVYEFAAQLLPVAAPDVTPPRVVRDGPADPELIEVVHEELAREAVSVARRHAGNGRFVGVICPDVLRGQLITEFDQHGISWADVRNGELGKSINLASPAESKGLEFDAVVVVQPAEIVTTADRGHRLLYVALTRTTKYLTVVHDGDALPLGTPDRPVPRTDGVLIHTVAEPPESAADVASHELTSDVTNSAAAVRETASDESIDQSTQTTQEASPPQVPEEQRPYPRDSETATSVKGSASSRSLDRVSVILARDLARDVRASLLPSKYRDFVEALRQELEIDDEEPDQHSAGMHEQSSQ